MPRQPSNTKNGDKTRCGRERGGKDFGSAGSWTHPPTATQRRSCFRCCKRRPSDSATFFLIFIATYCLAGCIGRDKNCQNNSIGLGFKFYDNAALARNPSSSGITKKAELSLKSTSTSATDPSACFLSGELFGTVSFRNQGVYEFDCRFLNTSTGWVWIDGHLVCGDGNPYQFREELDNPLPLKRQKAYPFRAHITSNDTSCGSLASLKVYYWKLGEADFRLGTKHEKEILTTSNLVSLTPEFPPAEQKREELQRNLAKGWGSWLRSNILSVVKLPEGLAVTPQLCQISSGKCLTSASPESKEIRVGLHAYDKSYVTYFVAFQSVNVSMEYAARDNQLQFLITPVSCPNADCSDYEIQTHGRYAWFRPGRLTSLSTGKTQSLMFSTPGLGNINVTQATSGISNKTSAYERRHMKQIYGDIRKPTGTWMTMPLRRVGEPVGFTAGMRSQSTNEMKAALQANKEREYKRLLDKFGTSKAPVAEAIQCAIMWTLIYVPVENGPIMPVSRTWTFQKQSGASTHDWSYILFGKSNLNEQMCCQ